MTIWLVLHIRSWKELSPLCCEQLKEAALSHAHSSAQLQGTAFPDLIVFFLAVETLAIEIFQPSNISSSRNLISPKFSTFGLKVLFQFSLGQLDQIFKRWKDRLLLKQQRLEEITPNSLCSFNTTKKKTLFLTDQLPSFFQSPFFHAKVYLQKLGTISRQKF